MQKNWKRKKDNFYLELIEIKELVKKLEHNNDNNPRKLFFDREISEAIKIYQKVLKKNYSKNIKMNI